MNKMIPTLLGKQGFPSHTHLFVCLFCLFVLLRYVPIQQLWSWQDSQFT